MKNIIILLALCLGTCVSLFAQTAPLTGGTIAGDQTLSYVGAIPSNLTSVEDASGGSDIITYQWQSSTDGTTWVSNAYGNQTKAYFDFITDIYPVYETTHFRRMAIVGSETAYSNTVTITVPFDPGGIGNDQNIYPGSIPNGLFSYIVAHGGSGPISYQWQSSEDNSTWTDIPGATNPSSYQPPALAVTTHFRRAAIQGDQTYYSNIVTITVIVFTGGTIAGDQILSFAGVVPAMLTNVVSASGGSSPITYSWEHSTDNVSWNSTLYYNPNSESFDFTIPIWAIYKTSYFRRVATSGSETAYSNTVTITVPFEPGGIGNDLNVDSGSIPYGFGSYAPASGGTGGTITYQWQKSEDNSTWIDIPGVTSLTYQSPALTVTTYFRRAAMQGDQTVYSNTVTVTVNAIAFTGGTIAGNQTIISGATPSPITSVEDASGGSAPITYSWQSSTDNSVWTSVSGAYSATYSPGTLTETTYFRRRAFSLNQTEHSNTVTISVLTTDANYILSTTYTAENGSESVADVEYYDGLGYPSQGVSIGASPDAMKSIVTPVYYDAIRRESRQYLPYVVDGNSGAYIPEALSSGPGSQSAFYNSIYGDDAAGYSYTENIYEASPLNRVMESFNVGNIFRTDDKKSTFTYGTNTATEVLRFRVTGSGQTQALTKASPGYYNSNMLYKNTVTNEDGTESTTYTDLPGRVVMERVVDGATKYDTYYVYDDRGNLCYVLPPKLVDLKTPTNASLSDTDPDMKALAYVYKYDGRNRCIEKRLPGAEPVYMVYDKGDRLMMTQDGNQRSTTSSPQQWLFNSYDNLNRLVSQRLVSNTGGVTLTTLRNHFDGYTYLPTGFSTVAVLIENTYGN